MTFPGRLASRASNAIAELARRLRYRLSHKPAGGAIYRFAEDPSGRSAPRSIDLRVAADRRDDAEAWAQGQTLRPLPVLSSTPRDTRDAGPNRLDASFFYAPGRGELFQDPAFAEAASLILAAEDIDALVFSGARSVQNPPEIRSIDDLTSPEIRPYAVFRHSAWHHDGATDRIKARKRRLRAKILLPRLLEPDAPGAPRDRQRRGSYVANFDLGPRADLCLRDASIASALPIEPSQGDLDGHDPRPRMLVLVPFLARGGAEHTIFETLHALKDRWNIAFVTLAPHRPELDDRRGDFQAVWPRILSFGDFVHPAAMPGMLGAVLDAFDPEVLYNANSTTLFFDFLPAIRRRRPELLIIDHLYDHRVGYIERYRETGLHDLVDVIVSENRRIQTALAETYGWPADRAPVVWPCGRPASAFPRDATTSRREARDELGFDGEDIIVLTAARMHEQKRPLDLIRLAERLKDLENLCFLIVGGGPLEDEVDRAAAAAKARGARIRRLPFRDDIPRLIQACDVGCLVSDYEGLPVFLLECLQVGRPFLGTDVGDLGFVLRGTGAGWVVDEPGDLDGLEAAARRLYDPAEREAKAHAALAAAPRFSVDACAQRYDQVFRGEKLAEIELDA